MKIKTQFRTTMFLFSSVLTAALALIIITDNQAERTIQQEELAVGIAQRANELSYLANDYLIYREDQHISRWQSRFDLLLKQTAGLNVDTPEEQMLVRNINENSRRLKETFDGVLSAVPNFPKDRSGDLNLEFLKISSSRLAVQTQGLFSDAQRLSHLIHDRRKMLRGTRTMLIYILLGLFGLFLFTNYILTYRRTMRSMATLQAGAKVIGSGDLDFRITKERDDEIGELSDAFNQMTAGLKTVTASRDELEKEIEERKRVEEAVRASEERFRVAQELLPDGFSILRPVRNPEGKVVDFMWVYANPALERIIGMTLPALAGRTLLELFPGHRESPFLEAYRRVAETGQTLVEESLYEGNGVLAQRWFRVAIVSMGQDIAVLSQDITERKQTEEAVKQSQETFAKLIERSPFGTYIVDSQFRIAMMNASSQEGAFCNVRPIIGRPFDDAMRILWPEPVAVEIISNFRHTLDTGEPYYSRDFVKPRHDTEIVEAYEWELHRITLPDGQYGVICYYYDSTKLREAENALRRSEARWNAAIENFGEGAIIATKDEQVIYWNPAARAMHGFKTENEGIEPLEETPKTFELWTPDGKHLLGLDEWPLRRIKRGETVKNLELRLRRPDQGWEKIVSYSGTMVETAGGEPLIFLSVYDLTEQRKAEAALRESEARIQQALTVSRSFTFEWLLATDEVRRSASCGIILGLSGDEAVYDTGQRYFQRVHADDRTRFVGMLSALTPATSGYTTEYRVVRGDGHIAVLEETGQGSFDAAGKLECLVGVATDITTRKQAEKARSESERKYRHLFENMAEEVHYWQVVRDEDGRIKTWRLVDANPATLKSWGRRTAEEIMGKTTDEIFGPGATEHYRPIVEKIMTEGIPYSFEDYFPNLGKHFRFTSVPLGDHFITTGADITLIKKTEIALRESEASLKRAQEIAHLGSWELDLVKNELTWSDEVYRIFGLQPQEFSATYEAFLECVHPEDRAAVDMSYSFSVREGKDVYEIEHRVVRKSTGEVRWVHEKCRHMQDRSGRIIRSVGMVHDITERKMWEEELGKLTEELKRSNSDLEQFAYIASHDLQSPLRNVEGFVQLLARRYKGKLDGKADEFIQYISMGVKDMQMLILDILEYSKLGSGGAPFAKVDISSCISRAIANLKDAAAERNADIVLEEPFPEIPVDSAQITSLFQNLIGNAIKFCKGIPQIRISSKREGPEHIFSVTDNGIGINPEDSDKIFAVFHRLHSKDEYPGTGIGLAICKRIVERHGGRIWMESAPGKGSTFFFTLPARGAK